MPLPRHKAIPSCRHTPHLKNPSHKIPPQSTLQLLHRVACEHSQRSLPQNIPKVRPIFLQIHTYSMYAQSLSTMEKFNSRAIIERIQSQSFHKIVDKFGSSFFYHVSKHSIPTERFLWARTSKQRDPNVKIIFHTF